ncbi:MAG: response regulator [Leptospiraceae bacterium]|nr:response regulator [Leptospiraceae bacterium]MCP5497198.1 response regulator [Leptospiraceae bacterium]
MNKENHILIIDDERTYLRVLETLLEPEGYSILCVQTPDDALEIIRKNDLLIGLIILDVQLGDESGFDLILKIKEALKIKYVPILFVSGYFVNKEDILYGISLGATDYLLKPFDLDLFRLKVKIYFEIFCDTYQKETLISDMQLKLQDIQKNFKKKVSEFDEKRQSLVIKLAETTLKQADLAQTNANLIRNYSHLEHEKRMLHLQLSQYIDEINSYRKKLEL